MLKQKEWIDVIVAKTGCSKKEAKVFYDCVFDYMREQISPEEVIKIAGFGVFKLRKTAAKEQINLVTGQAEIVPEHNVVTFKPYFEIDSKPEAIEVEDDDVVVEAAPVVEEVVATEDVVVDEVKEDVVEEDVVEDDVVEEVVNEEVKEVVVEEDNCVWVYNGKSYTTSDMQALLVKSTELSAEDVANSLNVVKENMKKVGKNVCEVKEEADTFEFIIAR